LPSKAIPWGSYRLIRLSQYNINSINTNNTASNKKETRIQLELELESEKKSVKTTNKSTTLTSKSTNLLISRQIYMYKSIN